MSNTFDLDIHVLTFSFFKSGQNGIFALFCTRNSIQHTPKTRAQVTLGGGKYGSLTKDRITKLQAYFTSAIRNKSTAEDMRRSIYATLHHCFSTDAAPLHDSCPPGAESYCFYQKALALGKKPGPHKVFIRTPLDRARLWKYMKPVYERMASDELLTRCLRKGTQNSNESMHNTVWAKCPKTGFFCKDRVEFGLLLGIAEFNFGPLFCAIWCYQLRQFPCYF